MTQEEILEYNKRCAEFLGLLKFKNLGNNKYKFGNQIFTINNDITNDPKEWLIDLHCNPKNTGHFKFYSDWNWIMEMVENIVEKTKFKTIDECSEYEWYATIGVTRLTIKSKKEAVVEAINRFLIWNENNNT